MTKEEFKKLTENTVLLDGAMGTNLMKKGMPEKCCAEEWIHGHKEELLEIQRAYISAGSRIIYAPTFSANRLGLKKHGLENKIEILNKDLVSYSREAADGQAFVAGDLTTTGEMLEPYGDLEYEEAVDIYKEQISFLCQAGVDLLVAETLFSIDEAKAVCHAAAQVCDLPVICTMTCDAAGKFFMGGDIYTASRIMEEEGADAFGFNCSQGPAQMVEVTGKLSKIQSLPLVVKPNAGMPQLGIDGKVHYLLRPEEYAENMLVLKDAGAVLLGGCCGTSPDYIRELKKCL